MPSERVLVIGALVTFLIAVLQLPLRVNLVALGLALLTLVLLLRGGRP